MDRGTRNLFALALVVVVVLTGAAAFLLGGSSLIDPGAPADARGRRRRSSPSESEGLDRVNGFDLRTIDQRTLAFTIGDLENGAEFPPGHLVEHQATAQPVRVWYPDRGWRQGRGQARGRPELGRQPPVVMTGRSRPAPRR